MKDRDFEPRRLARGMIALAPDRAEQIAVALIDDALRRGDHARAQMWTEVLTQIGVLIVDAKENAH